jgi:hypothetical protein
MRVAHAFNQEQDQEQEQEQEDYIQDFMGG